MLILKKTLLSWIKKIFSDLHNVVIGLLFLSLVGGGGVYIFFQNLWPALLNTMQSQTPLWATIVLVFLLVLYVEIKYWLFLKNDSLISSIYKIKYFNDLDKFVFEYKIFKNGSFEIIGDPICKNHDLRLYNYDGNFICPHNGGCENIIKKHQYETYIGYIKSQIDKDIRNKNKR